MSELEACSEDALLGGRLVVRQPRRGHRAGHDAILLAAATAAASGDRVVEFGAGVGTASLALAWRVGGLDLALVERDAALADLARGNLSRNDMAGAVMTLDVTAGAAAFAAAGLRPDSADAVLMNPPFHDDARHRGSPDAMRESAYLAGPDTLTQWLKSARRVLRPAGAVTLIWRADGLGAVLAALEEGFGGVAVLPVYGTAGKPAGRVVVRAIKGSRAPLRIAPPLTLNDSGGPTAEAGRILAGAALPLAEF